jgi:hypothetical protein
MTNRQAVLSLITAIASWTILGSILLTPLVGVYPLAWAVIGACFYASWYFDPTNNLVKRVDSE